MPKYKTPLKKIKPGITVNHLGMIYQVLEVDNINGLVTVENPETGFIGTYRKKLVAEHAFITKGEK